MWCAECGALMEPRPDGAWVRCCNGLGYWSLLSPLPRDSWWPVLQCEGLTFYPSGKWPEGRKPTMPSHQH